jgi:hypothetical protein
MNESDDRELDDYLEGKDGLSRGYRSAATELPPAHLDASILASSSKAAGSKPKAVSMFLPARWHVPVSIAAVMVLSVMVVFNLPEDQADLGIEPRMISGQRGADDGVEANIAAENVLTGNAVQSLDIPAVDLSQPVPDPQEQALRALSETAGSPFQAEPYAIEPEIRLDAPESPMDITLPAPGLSVSDADSAAFQDDRDVPSAGTVPPQTTESEVRERMSMDEVMKAQRLDIYLNEQPAAYAPLETAEVTPQASQFTPCTIPRPQICTMEYMPVCASRDTGIRCVTTPCDSTEQVEYSNACSACGDPEVTGYVQGGCTPAAGDNAGNR